jgi:hypothetical protein
MKVRDLIKKLQEYPNQDVHVFVYNVNESQSHELSDVDLDIMDRVDLNFNIEQGG